jgi:quercetin dioxygenase-like cupin family protein
VDASIHWSSLPVHTPVAGITGQVHMGVDLSVALFQLRPGAVVPRHHHVNEEFGQVLSGSLELEVDTVASRLTAGDGFLIPGNVPHAAVAGPEGCLLLECYAPARNPFVPQPQGASS